MGARQPRTSESRQCRRVGDRDRPTCPYALAEIEHDRFRPVPGLWSRLHDRRRNRDRGGGNHALVADQPRRGTSRHALAVVGENQE